MDWEDLLEPEVAVAVAVTAAVSSPKVRGVLRKGLVYTIGGVLAASDRMAAAGKSVAAGARRAARSAEATTEGAAESAGEATATGANPA